VQQKRSSYREKGAFSGLTFCKAKRLKPNGTYRELLDQSLSQLPPEHGRQHSTNMNKGVARRIPMVQPAFTE
jgi:hypothetical protein